MRGMDRLVGKTVKEVYLSYDGVTIIFKCDDEEIAYWAEGDCCSESWFNHITGIDNLIEGNAPVLRVVDKPEITGLKSTRQEVDIQYGYLIETRYGYCEIEFRNASNGYYGGWCQEITEGGSIDWEQMKQVTEDF